MVNAIGRSMNDPSPKRPVRDGAERATLLQVMAMLLVLFLPYALACLLLSTYALVLFMPSNWHKLLLRFSLTAVN